MNNSEDKLLIYTLENTNVGNALLYSNAYAALKSGSNIASRLGHLINLADTMDSSTISYYVNLIYREELRNTLSNLNITVYGASELKDLYDVWVKVTDIIDHENIIDVLRATSSTTTIFDLANMVDNSLDEYDDCVTEDATLVVALLEKYENELRMFDD